MAVQQVRAQVNGTWYILTLNSLTGKYEKSITAPGVTSFNLSGGYYPVTIEATDDSGNKTTDATGRLIVKETIAPVVTITSPTAGALLTNNKQTIRFTMRDEANGSGVKVTTLQLKIDSGTALTNTSPGMVCTAVTNGYDCTYTPPAALADGSHTITVNVQDNDGNAATAKSVTYKVDTTPPTLNISSPVDGLKTNQAAVTVSGITNDAVSSPVVIKITVGGADQGAVTVAADGNFTKSVPVAVGANTIVIRATDQAGKYTEITRTVAVNKTAPVISNIAAAPNPVNAGESVLISVTVTDA